MTLAFQFIPKHKTKAPTCKTQLDEFLSSREVLRLSEERRKLLIAKLFDAVNKPNRIQTRLGCHVFWIEKV